MDPADLPDVDESVDLVLRHVTHRFPHQLARAMLPPGTPIASAAWVETQLTARQRRLDRALEVVARRRRRLEHVEWQLEWRGDIPLRVFEYNSLSALSVAHEPEPPPIRSTVVLLSGREQPWPAEGEYRTSPPGARFSGVRFRIDAVYQRTVAELEARGPLWAVFAPLAVDADPAQLRRVLEGLRAALPERDFEELAVALTVMADVDQRQRGLRHAIVPLLREEIIMESWVYTQGKLKGLEEGKKEGLREGKKEGLQEGRLGTTQGMLRGVLERRTGRPPTPDEEQAIARRARNARPEQLVEVFDMPADAFLAWLLASD